MAAHSILRPVTKTRHGLSPVRSFGLAAALLAAALTAVVRAHDIPNDVTVQTFLKPEGHRLRLLVRVPLQAMRDMDYPKPRSTRGDLLDLSRADQTLRDAATLWISDFLDVYENDTRLPKPRVESVRAALPSDRSFTSYDEALAHLAAPPLPPETEFIWSQGLLDVTFEYPIGSDRSSFSFEPRLARLGLRTLVVLRFLPPGRPTRSFEFYGDPGFVRLDPTTLQAASRFATLGFFRILDGWDHLLFLVCLVLPFRRVRSLAVVVVAFTIAHSMTLIASAYHLAPDALWFPPLVATLIAASIIYMAVDDILFAAASAPAGSASPAPSAKFIERRWLATFGFGLAHGFSFGFALPPTLQFAGSHVLPSVLSFNLGIEAGQLLVVAVLVAAIQVMFRFLVADALGTIVVSALVGHTAWHWFDDRFAVLRRFRFEWPVVDAAFLASAMRWAMLAVIAAGLYWLIFGVLRAAPTSDDRGEPLRGAADRS
jgi:HupE/UreJ protein